MTRKIGKKTVVAAAVTSCVAGFAVPASLQAQGAQEVEEIIVTGSRIPRRDFRSTSPITTIDRTELKLAGITNVEETLNALPQIVPDFGRSTNNPGTGTATVNLRGLGGNRSLVLLNGRRFISVDVGGSVDLNNIPSGLIERIEVVSGGASAVYGSDALTGAVNFITKTDFEGIEVNAQYDVTERGDGEAFDVTLTGGLRLANDRIALSGFLNYHDRRSILHGDREFTREVLLDDIFTGQTFPGGSTRTPAGQIPNSVDIGGIPAPDGITFNDDGTPRPFVDPDDLYNYAPVNYLQLPLTRSTAAAFVNFDITSNTRLYSELMYVDTDTGGQFAPGLNFSFVQMNIDNPFVTPQTRQVFEDYFDPDGDGIADFILNKRLPELGPRKAQRLTELYRGIVGLEIAIGDNSTIDMYVIEAKSDGQGIRSNIGLFSRFQQSLLVDPATGQCMDTSNGCVPANVFGENNISEAAADFIRVAPVVTTIDVGQSILGATLVGDLFTLPAGNIGYALGIELRDEDYTELDQSGLTNERLLGLGAVVDPVIGEIELREIFAEVLVPLLSDKPFAQYLGLEAGYRYTDHSLAGGFDTWKLAADWEVLSGYKLRASMQQAVRAPNAEELFQATFEGINPFVAEFADLCSASFNPAALGIADVCIAQGIPASQIGVYQATPFFPTVTSSGGNLLLDPEQSDTLTAGIVIEPGFLPDLSLSIDYYSIQIDNAIQFVGAFDTILLCWEIKNPLDPLCQAVERDPATLNISRSTGGPRNVAKIETEGIDLQITYDHDLPQWMAIFDNAASLRWNFIGNHTIKNGTQPTPDVALNNCAGFIGFPCDTNSFGSLPAHKTKTRVTYNSGPLSLSLQWRWTDGMVNAFLEYGLDIFGIPRDAVNFAIPSVPSRSYFALSFDYDINDNIEIYGGVNNLLDQDPPLLASNQNQSNTDPTLYDVYGRRYFIGLTARFWN